MKAPTLRKGEHVNSFMNRMEEYRLYLINDKYNLILKFVNMWLTEEYKSLSEFKNISEKRLLKDPKHNRDTLRKYASKFKKVFNSNFTVEDDTDSDDITDKYIIYVASKLLAAINYKFGNKKVGERLYYYIIQK
jgi:cysteinyl-tRNA synthetase